MRLACISAEGRGETDRLLSESAAWLVQNGRSVIGVVKESGLRGRGGAERIHR